MRDLHVFGDATLTLDGVLRALGDLGMVRAWPEHGQIEVRDGDDHVIVRDGAPDDLPVDYYTPQNRDRIREVVGASWNPLTVQFRGTTLVDAVLRRIATSFTVVIDTTHGHLIRGEEWAELLVANPSWDLMSPPPGQDHPTVSGG